MARSSLLEASDALMASVDSSRKLRCRVVSYFKYLTLIRHASVAASVASVEMVSPMLNGSKEESPVNQSSHHNGSSYL